jgi:hypothetical protein
MPSKKSAITAPKKRIAPTTKSASSETVESGQPKRTDAITQREILGSSTRQATKAHRAKVLKNKIERCGD